MESLWGYDKKFSCFFKTYYQPEQRPRHGLLIYTAQDSLESLDREEEGCYCFPLNRTFEGEYREQLEFELFFSIDLKQMFLLAFMVLTFMAVGDAMSIEASPSAGSTLAGQQILAGPRRRMNFGFWEEGFAASA